MCPLLRLSLLMLLSMAWGCASDPAGVTARPAFFDPDPVAPPPDDTGETAAPPRALVLNEVQTRNDSTVMAPDGSLADWVELFNAGDAPVELSRVTLVDGGDGGAWRGAGTLAPGERVVLWSEVAGGAQAALPFRLSGGGERLTLSLDDVVVDRLDTGDLPADTALARFPDGGAWRPTARPTPGQTNGSAPSATLDPSDTLFEPTTVHTIEILLPEEALSSLRRDPYTEVEGSLGFQGVFFPQVAVRLKGVYGSLRSVDAKAAFRIDLNDYEDYRLRGVEILTLNNMVQDYTAMHESISYAQLRALGVPAPRTAYARVWVNGEDRGLYAIVETPDENLIERWFVDASGALWEGAYGVDFWSGYESLWDHDGGPEDPAILTAVMSALDGMASPPSDADIATLDTLVDLDQWLRVLAWEAVALHWDGYTTANNYRVYHNPVDGRFALLPWGLDQTWTDQWYGPWDGYGRIFTTCIANAACRRRYDDALVEVAAAVEAMEPAAQLDALSELVRVELETDAFREYSMGTHRTYSDITRNNMQTLPAQVRAAAALDRLAVP